AAVIANDGLPPAGADARVLHPGTGARQHCTAAGAELDSHIGSMAGADQGGIALVAAGTQASVGASGAHGALHAGDAFRFTVGTAVVVAVRGAASNARPVLRESLATGLALCALLLTLLRLEALGGALVHQHVGGAFAGGGAVAGVG